MNTITTTKPILSSLEEVWAIADNQVTAQELLNERLYMKDKGWGDVYWLRGRTRPTMGS